MVREEDKILKFIWKVENFSFFSNKTGDFLKSPNFVLEILEGSEWFLKLYPRGTNCSDEYVGIFLVRLMSRNDHIPIRVDFEIAILGLNGEFECVQEMKDQSFRRQSSFGFNKFITREQLLGTKKSVLLPRDVLTVQCRILPKSVEMESYNEVTAKTCTEIERLGFGWESEEFASEIEYFRKHELSFQGNEKCLKMEITLSTGEKPSSLSGFLRSEKILMSAHLKICLLDSNNSVTNFLANEFLDISAYFVKKSTPYSFPFSFTLIPEIFEYKHFYFPNGKMNLLCEFTLCHGFQRSQIETVVYGSVFPIVIENENNSLLQMGVPPENTESPLVSDFQKLYQEGALCDFTLKVGSTNLEVHKAILCARSPIFKAMLTCEIKEDSKNMVEISDLEVDTVQRMLTYIYTNFVDYLDWETAYKLYIAAEKFGLMGLKHTCLKVIKQNISVNNVQRILALANTYKEESLKKVIIDFISKNEKEVMCSVEWKNFIKKGINSAIEILQGLILRKARITAIPL